MQFGGGPSSVVVCGCHGEKGTVCEISFRFESCFVQMTDAG